MSFQSVTFQMTMGLPTRRMMRSVHSMRKDTPDYSIKLSKSEEDKVYWAYWEYVTQAPVFAELPDAVRRQKAHQKGKIAVAYMECRCRECRFISPDFCPESFESVLGAYEGQYPEESKTRYKTDERAGLVDEEVYFNESPCLIVQAMRVRDEVMNTLWPDERY